MFLHFNFPNIVTASQQSNWNDHSHILLASRCGLWSLSEKYVVPYLKKGHKSNENINTIFVLRYRLSNFFESFPHIEK